MMKLKIEDRNMEQEKITTDELFNLLPNRIVENEKIYHFILIKGTNRIIVKYEANICDGGGSLGSTYRSGNTLNEALLNMGKWLFKFGYLPQKETNIISDMIKIAYSQIKRITNDR